jgi:divalent metal cation (Fe/Co/Zn/Cd) transporter
VVVAVRLGLDSGDLLLGRAADAADQQLIRDRIEELPGVDELVELLTMYMGPDRLIVAARVAFSDQIDADAVEDLAERIDRELSGQLSATPHVFIDPTDTASGSRGSAGRPAPLLPDPAEKAG